MASLNETNLIGNLGADPEIRYFPDGTPTSTISLATAEKWKDKQSGEVKERTEWHRVVFIGNIVKVVEEYLKKGSQIYVKGKLRTRKWTDKDGIDRYTTEIYARDMKMLGKKAAAEIPAVPSHDAPGLDSADGLDDDIPF